jgi:predicted RNA-binding Zn ribbon-like protein
VTTVDLQPGGRPPAPGDLRIVQAFLNSKDIEGGSDEFSDPKALRAWLTKHGLLNMGSLVTRADLVQAVEFRESLRSVLASRDVPDPDEESLEILNHVVATTSLGVVFEASGAARLVPRIQDIAAAWARLVVIAYNSTVDDTWARLKICRNDRCRWAYYDHSRNRSGTWCTMKVCGAQEKARAFRRRAAVGVS